MQRAIWAGGTGLATPRLGAAAQAALGPFPGAVPTYVQPHANALRQERWNGTGRAEPRVYSRSVMLSPPMSPVVILVLAVLATTCAGPIVRFAAAPALAVSFWRLVLVLPVTLVLSRREPAGEQATDGRERGMMVLAGLLLAPHFWAWIASLRFTTVASSVLLVNLRPIFVWAIAALWLGEHPRSRERWGIALAVLGATLIGVGDARLLPGALTGDALALAGAVAAAGYSVIGRRVRRTVGVWSYVTVVYAAAALALGLAGLLSHTPLTGFARRDWTVFAALAAGPMLLGHTRINYALKHFRA